MSPTIRNYGRKLSYWKRVGYYRHVIGASLGRSLWLAMWGL